MDTKTVQRRYDLDWLRVLAILAIFVFHSTRFFDTDDWHLKNSATYLFVDVWKQFATSWGMPLILIISGASVFFALDKVKPGKYLQGIAARLFVPLLFGMFTHVTLQVYLENLQKGKFSGSFLAFYPHYFDGMYGFGGNFAWMGLHLWYLEILFILSLLCLPLFWWLKHRASGQRVLKALGDFLALPGAVYLLILPVLLLVNALDPETWGNRDMGGWAVFTYPCFFISGFVILSNQRLQERIQQMRWISLGLGLVVTVAYLLQEFSTRYAIFRSYGDKPADLMVCPVAWVWLLTVLGFGMKHLNFNTPFLKYANEGVLPFYILHQTVLLVLGYFVVGWAIPDLLKWLTILVISFAISMGLYEYLVRRFNLLRFLFGMKVLPKSPAARPQLAPSRP